MGWGRSLWAEGLTGTQSRRGKAPGRGELEAGRGGEVLADC